MRTQHEEPAVPHPSASNPFPSVLRCPSRQRYSCCSRLYSQDIPANIKLYVYSTLSVPAMSTDNLTKYISRMIGTSHQRSRGNMTKAQAVRFGLQRLESIGMHIIDNRQMFPGRAQVLSQRQRIHAH